MRLLRRLLAALAGTAVALTIAAVQSIWDISTDRTGVAGDAAARGAAGVPLVATALFIFYLALASLTPLLRTRPYVSAAVSVALATAVLVLIPSIVWTFSERSLPTLGAVLGGLLIGTCWLMPGALVQVPMLQGLRSAGPKQTGPGHV